MNLGILIYCTISEEYMTIYIEHTKYEHTYNQLFKYFYSQYSFLKEVIS